MEKRRRAAFREKIKELKGLDPADVPVEKLHLRVVVYELIKEQGINTVADLIGCEEVEMEQWRDMKANYIDEIKGKLELLGFSVIEKPVPIEDKAKDKS